MAAMVLPCAMFTACEDDPDPKPDVEDPYSAPITNETTVRQNIDDSYVASPTEIQKAWEGSYTGYDTNQETNTNIKRLLVLKSNKQYENVIQGVLVKSGKSEFVNFELERGTYSYNANSGVITYTVSSDSILNYGDQSFTRYNGKKYYSHTDGTYTETVKFSKVKDGQRSWITQDTYLQSLTASNINIYFAMVGQVGDKK